MVRKEWAARQAAVATTASTSTSTTAPASAVTDEEQPQTGDTEPSPRGDGGTGETSGDVLGNAHVQHAGTWLCLGLLEAHGLHRALAQTRREAGVSAERLRVATEALAAALWPR